MKSHWPNFHQIARNSFIASSAVYVSNELNFSNTSIPRCFWSAPVDPSSFVELKSEEDFNNALRKARDGSVSSVFYFTAAWCGPCRLISPVILELSKKYPDVTTYKVDIDEKGLSNSIGKLNVAAVPTLQFYKGGVKKAEVVGVDIVKLKSVMEHLYK